MTQSLDGHERTTGAIRNLPIHVTSEIGELKTVLLKRPGRELENLTPDHLGRLLFDDIPHLPVIQKEHDYFAAVLRNRGIEVLYLEKLMEEVLAIPHLREQFVANVLEESKSNINGSYEKLRDYLLSFDNEQLVEAVMAGIRKTEIPHSKRTHLHEMIEDTYPFYLDPMPNLYFTRDPAAAIGDGLTINRMKEPARRRESLFMHYIITYHPRFAKHDIPVWSDREYRFSMEGGDELVLSKEVLAIGISERTTAQGIERLARNLFERSEFKKVIAIEIPKSRAFMHLDTVFTMVDYDKFTIHSAIQGSGGQMNIFELTRGADDITITKRTDLLETLKEALHLDHLVLIPCGGGDAIASAREQWSDGSNTLAIAPGVVVTYDRNYVSNELLRSHGIEVIEIGSSELSRGRGGPRCMSCPLVREDI
ncbi:MULTISPECIES: arginine deiminase [Exiguobacterium]|uniref:Arginine deiminase n=1 Tax=Exiguobacterium antarcticum TaxID=132920 RepID=A0ABT6R1Q1_9BACL|nr:MULTISPECIES: arginine deiminase [Exiguobacterium]MCT4779197.1 arginine deiminase [Exiguobacterium soli]MDI3234872.1 arginine deiminase [Exiguobacterium antarcticum]OIN66752.1 arginine deiminase [Exiguobacterium sp. KRL4]